MARYKKPSKIAEIDGYFKKHPERRNNGEPIPTRPIGPAPLTYATESAEIWDEIVAEMPAGVLTCADRIVLEIACNLISQFRQNPTETPVSRLAVLERILSKFGMNPSDRTRLSVPEFSGTEPADGFFS